MLPTFVIGLRECLEASLIVGIIAAFLVSEQRRDVMRWVWAGVAAAVALCAAVAVGLEILSRDLPERPQEAFESIIALVAAVTVSYMVVWMRRHARDISSSLRREASGALASGSVTALVAMTFLAVLREGFETAVFLLAVLQQSQDPGAAETGAVLGIVVAAGIGYGIYRGGIRLNLARFFRITALVLVFVSAGLVASAVHAGHEAGWVTVLQGQALDLRWLIRPGTPLAAMLTGMLGLQAQPTQAESIAYLIYLVPMMTFVLWPAGRAPVSPRRIGVGQSEGALP